MQYLLSQEELDELHKAAASVSEIKIKTLQEACTFIADNVPVDGGWMNGKIWGCVLTEDTVNGYGYCNDCPAKKLCPYEHKSWSK